MVAKRLCLYNIKKLQCSSFRPVHFLDPTHAKLRPRYLNMNPIWYGRTVSESLHLYILILLRTGLGRQSVKRYRRAVWITWLSLRLATPKPSELNRRKSPNRSWNSIQVSASPSGGSAGPLRKSRVSVECAPGADTNDDQVKAYPSYLYALFTNEC